MITIKRAKQEIKDTVEAYLLKNEYGEYEIPIVNQRPILLLGAPGIGKTQIMEQVARECGISLVSYTITHHTRQSAIGLPFITEKVYGGLKKNVTEYTMSEIIASVYDKIEKTGIAEGILFIDEINCVSETLAPAMLQFLQCKTFGSHAVPEGWVIAAAGNPPEYNRSVREFDVVTLDRVKKIEVAPDYQVWKEYAYQHGIHAAVISYLNTRPKNFCRMETTVDGRLFATPRGWEDVSRALKVYEKLEKSMDKEVVGQYIQHPEIAADFADYLELYRKYQTDYQIDEILSGCIPDILLKKVAHAPFDERLGVMELLLSRLNTMFQKTARMEDLTELLYEKLKGAREALCTVWMDDPYTWLLDLLERAGQELAYLRQAELLDRRGEHLRRDVLAILDKYLQRLRLEDVKQGPESFEKLCSYFEEENALLDELYEKTGAMLEHVFDFMEAAFGEGQEMVIFVTELNTGEGSVRFLQKYDCERYHQYNERLFFKERSRTLLERINRL